MDLWWVMLWVITLGAALGLVWWNQQLQRQIDHLNIRVTRLNIRVSTQSARMLVMPDLDRHEANMHHECEDCEDETTGDLNG